MTSLLLALALSAGPARWTATDTAWEASYLALDLVDWQQTRRIAERPGQITEYNPLLGAHPSPGKVNAYFLAGAALHPLVSYLLAPRWRRMWQVSGIGLEFLCVGQNYHAGISWRF